MFLQNPQITIIGAGKIAYSLLPALKNSGYNVSSIISKTFNSAKKLAEINSVSDFSDSLTAISEHSNIFILSVPDSEILNLSNRLSKLNFDFDECLFIHLSGTEDISELKPLINKGAYTAAFHIMQTFPSKEISDISGSYVSVETSNDDVKNFLFSVAKDLKLNPFVIKSNHKSLYHLAGVFASNFLVGNLFESQILFNESKNEEMDFFKVLEPIIFSTLENIKKKRSYQFPIRSGSEGRL